MTEEKKCVERVYERGSRWPHPYPCANKPKVEREGKFYCTIHDPVRVKAKREERSAKWEAEIQAQSKKWRLERAAPAMLAALKHCAEALSAIAQAKGLVADHGDALDEALKAIASAEKDV